MAATPNTLYVHPVSGNCLGAMLYIREKRLNIKIEIVDIMKGEQMADWFVALNPNHSVPTLCDSSGKGVWESGAILRHLAKLANDRVSDTANIALDWRQSTCYKFFAKIYVPHLGFEPLTAEEASQSIDEGIEGLQKKMEPVMRDRFLNRDHPVHGKWTNKFIGGPVPNIADYSLVPCLTMLTTSRYWDVADKKVKQYVEDFKAAVKCWDVVAKTQTDFVASKQQAKPGAITGSAATRRTEELNACLAQVQEALQCLRGDEDRNAALSHCKQAKTALESLRNNIVV